MDLYSGVQYISLERESKVIEAEGSSKRQVENLNPLLRWIPEEPFFPPQ